MYSLAFILFAAAAAGDKVVTPDPPSPFGMLVPLLGIGALFYFLMIRPQKKEQTRRQSMLAAIKKNDNVITNSGIYGVVTNIHAEANKITIRVDETTNTKLCMTMGSIAQVLGDQPSENIESK